MSRSGLLKLPLMAAFLVIFESSCKIFNAEMASETLASTSLEGRAIVAVGKFTSLGEALNEHRPSLKACIGSGHVYRNCSGYLNLKVTCPHPPKLIVRPKEPNDGTGPKRCHRFEVVEHADGSVSVQTFSSVEPKLAGKSDKPNCLAVGSTGEALYKTCDPNDREQKLYWDKGENGGYGFIKWLPLEGSSESVKCLDVTSGGTEISGDTILQFAACKPYSAGPISDSNNQRFYLEP